MCGNIGMITDSVNAFTRKFMWQGLYVDALRGMDSTGLATVDKDGEIMINKKAMPAIDFLNLKKVDNQIDDYANRVFIGHNRAATFGAINNVNAHPFQYGKITLVHNGSLKVTSNLPDHKDFDVDSENIAHSMNKIGDIETLKLLNGAFALVWWDSEEKRVKMCRNDERPLTVGKVKGKNTIIWASEENMLSFTAGRTGLTLEDTWDLPTNCIASFDPESKDIWECDITKNVEFYKYPFSQSYGRGYENGYDASFHGQDYLPFKGRTDTKTEEERKKDAEAAKAQREKALNKVKNRDVESNKIFKEMGLKKGDKVEFVLYDFKPYNNRYPDTGMWEGCTTKKPYTTTILYGHSGKDHAVGDEFIGECNIMQRIDPTSKSDDPNDWRLVINNTTLSETLEDNEYAESVILLEDKSVKKHRGILTISGRVDPLDEEEEEAEEDTGREGTETDDASFLYVMGPRGIAISERDWNHLTKHGCGICAKDLDISEAKDLEWWGETKCDPVCPSCLDEMSGGVVARLH